MPSPSGRADLKKSQAERRRIMKAAYTLLGQTETGWTSVQKILDEAGVSTRAFYRHFLSKDDMIVSMYREDGERATAALAAAVGTIDDPVASLEAWMDHWLGLAFEPRQMTRVRALSSGEAQSSAGFRRARSENMAASVTILTQVLIAGQRAGIFRPSDPHEDARAMQAVVLGLLDTQIYREQGLGWSRAREHTMSMFERLLDFTSAQRSKR